MTESTSFTCATCGAQASGRFCSACGSPVGELGCAACHTTLSPGAKFCHRCGTPAGTTPPTAASRETNPLPWAFAAISLLALITLVASQRFNRPTAAPADGTQADAASASAAVRAPDISQMSPEQRAERLYDRMMGAFERGQPDTVRMFAPMAVQAYQMLDSLNLDQRYDLGRLGEISGDLTLAGAEADTILKKYPTHLLGLILAAKVARARNDTGAEHAFRDRLVKAAPTERTKQLPEYLLHANDITIALSEAR